MIKMAYLVENGATKESYFRDLRQARRFAEAYNLTGTVIKATGKILSELYNVSNGVFSNNLMEV